MHRLAVIPLYLALNVLSVGANMPSAGNKTEAAEQKRADVLERVWQQLEAGDSWQAAAFVESQGEPVEVAVLYSNLVRDIYGKKHDVPRMILIGQAGIRFCLQQARAVETKDPEAANQLKGIAKTTAYNLSANTWPAWEDAGIVITRSDQQIGLDAARLNLRLAQELGRGPDKIGGAHWLLGAHHIALGRTEEAVEHLQLAVEKAREAGTPDAEQMARGYIAIARLSADTRNDAARTELDAAIEGLKKIGTDDAKFFAGQLLSVHEFFTREAAAD